MARDPFPGVRALATLDAAARHLNFTRAADEIGLTPAAVSHQVKEFEDQLGIRLFLRTSRSMRLTGAGEIVHAAIAEALDGLARARARVKPRLDNRLRVSASASIAAKWLVPRIDEFMRLYPDIDVRIDVSSQIRDLIRDDVDVAFRWGTGDYPGLRADRLFEHSIFPVCSPRLLDSRGPLDEPMDLFRYKLIHVSWNGQGVTWPSWRMWLLAAGIHEFDDGPGLHFMETGPAIQAAIDGQGIALGDSSLVADDLATGRLVQPFALSIKGPPMFAYYVVTPPDAVANSLVAKFRDWVLEEAAATPIAATSA